MYIYYIYIYICYPDAPWCWNIYLHLPQKWPSFVGKYSSTMEHVGYRFIGLSNQVYYPLEN